MDRKMININANLVKESEFSEFEKDGESVQVANFALVKKYGKGKEYTKLLSIWRKGRNCKRIWKRRSNPCLWIFQRK